MRKISREFKSTVFTTLFNDPKKILELYNAIEGTDYDDETKISIETLENTVFVDKINDLAFCFGDVLIVLIEHQSTYCPNMPFRLLGYITREYEKMYAKTTFYGKNLVKIRTPRFYVLYNGDEPMPPEFEMKLSDAYKELLPNNSLEIVVKCINIGYNQVSNKVKKSESLFGYSRFVQIVKEARDEHGDTEEAASLALERCIKEGVLLDFLQNHGLEVVNMAFKEFNYEDQIKQLAKESRDEGRAEGKIDAHISLVKAGTITIAQAAKSLDITQEEFEEYMKA